MLYVVIGVLLLVLFLDAIARLSIYRLVIVGLIALSMLYPLGKNLIKTSSPRKVYKVARTVTAAVSNPQATITIEPTHKKLWHKFKSYSCRKFEKGDRHQKEGRVRERIRQACESKKPKEKE